jgi:tetratricopeptide (TPR) repeat protein
MMNSLNKTALYLKIIWNHIVFWSFPTPEEDYYLRLGTIYFYLEKYRKAIALLEKSEKAHNHQDAAYSKYNCFYLGYCYLNLGNFEKAIENFDRYLRFKKNPELLRYLSWLYMLVNRPLDALETCLLGAQIEPASSAWHFECARILIELNRNDEAREHIKLAETNAKDENERNMIEAIKYKFEGQIDKGLNILRDIILRNSPKLDAPQTADLYVLMARYQREMNDSAGVMNSLKKAFENNPTDIWLANELAMEYADQEIKLDEALSLMEKAIKYQPENAVFIDTKGWVLFKMGRKEEAKREIEQSLILNPDCKDTKEHYKQINADITLASRGTR